MSLFSKFLILAFKEKYIYRFDFYISILASILVILVQINVWEALYKGNSVDSASLKQMITYVLLSSIIFSLTRSEAGNKIGRKVEDGSIISDFTRPVNFRSYLFAEDLGNNFFQVLFISLPAVTIVSIFFGFSWEGDLVTLSIFLLSLVLGVIISFYIKYIIGMFAFWLETSWYIPFFVGAIFELFSGSTIPLWFFPDWLSAISSLLPFRLIFFEPISIFLNKYSYVDSFSIICTQITWLVLLVIFEKILWFNAQKKVVIHGG
ncbi:ABC-2 family transporter protein [Paraliobacillus sp. X-1268]|uniref:ABC transporter permease n=1 Tax=Paraliobacillus sp. X-1268 TaxID=2213193 RepID=UPI000E3E4268|nr:ABC-2 family transporter protein [Paraliobacillus sp. X-1268]